MDVATCMRAYTKVIETGGFSAAARAMRVSPSAVTKYVAALERQVGAQLLQRSTRSNSPTDIGRAFYDRCVAVLSELDDALDCVAGLRGQITGSLRVNAPMTFGTLHLAPLVAEFMARHPQLRVELVLNDRMVDPIEEGFDVSLRISQPELTTSLVVTPIVEAGRILCAAPEYLVDAGELEQPADLKLHRCLQYGYQHTGNSWHLVGPAGARAWPVDCVMWSNNGEVLRAAALAGQGIALLPTFIVGRDLQDGRLRRVLTAYSVPALVMHALYPRHRHLSAKVRAFVEFLSERYREPPRWNNVS